MPKNVNDTARQAKHALLAYNYIANSQGKVTLRAIAEALYAEHEIDASLLRRVQRIADLLVEMQWVCKERHPKREGNLYSATEINISGVGQLAINRSRTTLAYYFLKAFADQFNETELSGEFDTLTNAIKNASPEGSIPEEDLMNIVLPGLFDFGIKPRLLINLLKAINEKEWLEIKYIKQGDLAEKTTTIAPAMLSIYEGVVYLIAYNPHAKKYLTYSVYNIISYSVTEYQACRVPPFDREKHRRERFAVIDGPLARVSLTIAADMSKYFENRRWHPSQSMSYDNQGNLVLSFESPIAPDLVSWVMRWSEAIIGIEPVALKSAVEERISRFAGVLKMN